jgi:hypothetical protein
MREALKDSISGDQLGSVLVSICRSNQCDSGHYELNERLLS